MMAPMQKPLITVYGIANCDTVKRARVWLNSQGLAHAFHDFKKQGLPEPLLAFWVQSLGWQVLLNTRGTTWRRLDDAQRAAVVDAASAQATMQAQPSLIKRPLVQWHDASWSVGFDAASWLRRCGMAVD
jgi:Spx/MgsR family transcriptional regulator